MKSLYHSSCASCNLSNDKEGVALMTSGPTMLRLLFRPNRSRFRVRTDHSSLVVPVDEAREMGRLFKSLAMREKRHSHPRKESRKPDSASLDKAVLMRPIRLSTLPCDEWLLGGATTISQQNFDLKEVVRSMIE